MTRELLKYILRGALKGIEEYEAMLEQKHVDPSGTMAEILKDVPDTPAPSGAQKAPEKVKTESLDLGDLLQEIN